MQSFTNEACEIPTDREIVTHIMQMEDEEFDTYLADKEYTKRQDWKAAEEAKFKKFEEE